VGLVAVGMLLPTALPYGMGHMLPSPAASIAAPTSSAAGSSSRSSTSPSSWNNISSTVGTPPGDRSIAQAAYSPALNATILFGGYNGAGGNFALGDTWEFANGSWTELFPSVSPSPRWGGTMVYDPTLQSLVLFGGRDATAFFNDTWEYNATGWHSVITPTAPSVRYDYGLAYDAVLGDVVLYGGGIGNNPAGTFTNFTFYTDTWTFRAGVWTNITATAGPGPVGRLIRGQMAYDSADGSVLLTGGYSYVPLGSETPCGYVEFEPLWGETWELAGGTWSEVFPTGATPPDGMGVLWFDAEANETLYYEGMWNGTTGLCDVSGNQVWSYAAGNWTLVTEGNVSAPAPREQPILVDDQADHAQLEFGGELASTASEYYAAYLNDTWTYQPTWVTFEQHGLPSGAAWQVTVEGTVGTLSGEPLLFVEAPGNYSYVAVVTPLGRAEVRETGTFALVHGPVVVVLAYRGSPSSAGPAPFLGVLTALLAGGVLGAVGIGVWAVADAAARRARLRREGERLVAAMVSQSEEPAGPRRP
jgi:Kelch motif protein